MINLGNIEIADLRLGASQVKALYLGSKQVWSLGQVVPKYDIQSIGRSTSQQGTSIEITEQAGETITLYIKTNATEVTNKQVCAAVYLNSTDVTPYTTFAFSNVSMSGRYIVGTTPDVSSWVPSGFPETYSTLYMKTWIQDAGIIDPVDALGEVLDWTGKEATAEPLRFTAAGSNASVQLVHGSSAPSVSLQTSTDGVTWTSYSNEVISLPNAGDKVYFRATDINGAFFSSQMMHFEALYANYFDCSNVVVSGKLVSIFRKDMDESSMATPDYLAKNLFRNYNNRQTQIVDASGLEIPDKTYGVMAFQGAFSGSTLSAAPAFPGNAQIYCEQYAWLYENCTKLSSLPGNCLPSSPLTAFSTDRQRSGYGWYDSIANALPLTSDLSVVISDAASIPSYVFYNIFASNSPFTGTFIIDMTSYTSVPTIQSNTFNSYTKPPRGSLEIRVPASLYDTWKAATNWTTYASYIVPVS